MNSSHFVRILWTLATSCLLMLPSRANGASDAGPTRPYFSIFCASIDRAHDFCEQIFDSVNRSDLAHSLIDRLKSDYKLEGIDRSRPFGLFSLWGDSKSTDILFLPIKSSDDIDELLKSVTLGIVGYEKLSSTHYRIDRPGSPYEAVIQDGYVLFGDSLAVLKGLSVTPEQLTRGHRERYEATILVDPTQVPAASRLRFVRTLRDQVEPTLQPQDDEVAREAQVRRATGNLLMATIERTFLDISSVVVGASLDQDDGTINLELSVQALKNSQLSMTLGSWSSRRSHLTSLMSKDSSASLAGTFPKGELLDDLLKSITLSDTNELGLLETGIRVVGSQPQKMSLVGVLRADKAASLSQAIPEWIQQLASSKRIHDVIEEFEVINGVALDSFFLSEVPNWLVTIVGPAPEVIVGRGHRTVWLGVGQASTILDDLKDTIDRVNGDSDERPPATMLRAQLRTSHLIDLVKLELPLINVAPEVMKQELKKGDDELILTVEPISGGIKLRLTIEEALLRLIGRDWVNQLESRLKTP